MILNSIKLENIRSYIKDEIKFEKGINFLSGDIGSGKSSILLAIEFALFGFKKGDLEAYSLIRKGSTNAQVTLNLSINNKEIEISRNIKKSKTTNTQENGYIKIDNSIEELSPNELTSKIFEILNFPKEFISKDKNLIYRFTIYTPQEQLKEILFKDPEKRLEVVRKLFQIDKYKQIKDSIIIYNSKIREDKRYYEKRLEGIEKLENEIRDIKKEIDSIQIEKNKILIENKELSLQEENLKEKKNKRSEQNLKIQTNKFNLEKAIYQIDEYENQIRTLSNKQLEIEKKIKIEKEEIIKNKEEDNTKLEEEIIKEKIKIEENEIKLKELNNEKDKLFTLRQKEINLKNKKEKLEKLNKEFDLILTKCQIKDAENELIILEKKIKKEEKKQEELNIKQEELMKNEISLKNLKEKNLEIKNKLNSILSINNCPSCLQEINLSHHDKIKKEFNLNIEENENQIKIKTENILKIKTLIEDLRIILKTFDEDKKKSILLNQKIKNLYEKEKDELKKEKEKNDLIEEIENEEKENYKEEFEKLEEQIKKIEKIEKQIKEDKENLDKLNEKNNKFKENKFKEKTRLERIFEFEEEIEKNNKEIEKLKEKTKKKKEYEEKLFKNNENEELIKKILIEIEKEEKEIQNIKHKYIFEISKFETQIEEKNKRLEQEEKNYSNFKKEKIKYEKILREEDFLNKELHVISSIIEKVLMRKYYSQFNETFEEIFKELIEDSEIDIRLDESFSPLIEQNGYEVEIKNLSGGEKSSLALAYRLALKKTLEINLSKELKLNLLILDEPSDGFSQYQIERLGSILKESKIKQIILVSHDSKIENIADKIIHVEKISHISKTF